MNRIHHRQYNTRRTLLRQKQILIWCTSALCLLLAACGGSSESNTTENQTTGDMTIAEDYLFFLVQTSGWNYDDVRICPSEGCTPIDSRPDEFDIYQVASAAGHDLNKLNTAPVSHLFKTSHIESVGEGQQTVISSIVWLENGQILGARSDNSAVITIASQNLNQTFCSINSPITFSLTRLNVLEEAGEDRNCESADDNITYLFELQSNAALTPDTENASEPIWGYPFMQPDESGLLTVYTFRYVDAEQKTIITNTQSREVVAEYPFEIPYQNMFQIKGWLFVMEDERLTRISLSELKNGTFDISTAYIPLSRNVADDRINYSSTYYGFLFGASETGLVNDFPNEPIYLVGMNDVKTLNLSTGEVSAPVSFSASFYYPSLGFLKTPGLAHVRNSNGDHYFVDVNTGQADLVFVPPPSGSSSSSYHEDLLLFSNEGSRGAGRGAYVISRTGLEHSYSDATWQSIYSNELDNDRYVMLLTATSPNNDYKASIQLIDKNDFSIVRNLGSYTSPYHNISIGFKVGYEFGRYQLVTDTYNSNVFIVDMLTENSLTYLLTANGSIKL